MHLRRALLLFAIVLGLAALAASVSRPDEEPDERSARPAPGATDTTPTVSPGTALTVEAVELHVEPARRERLRIETGQAATLFVAVDEPGQVEIPDLGLSGFADPVTSARFELFVADPGRYEISLTPSSGDESRPVATLIVEPAEA